MLVHQGQCVATRRTNVLLRQLVATSCAAEPASQFAEINPSYEGPLHGLRVLDLTQMVSGPMGTQLLGDQGADIIKIESTGSGASERGGSRASMISPLFAVVGRNKRSVSMDLKHPLAREAFLKLVPTADVVVQNFRPGVVERMGIGYEDLKKINPRLIYCSITGFGREGPYSGKRVYDPVIQAVSGLASTQADENGRPQLLKLIVPDKVTALTSAQAITAAVVQRYRTGSGCHINLSMLDSVLAFAWPQSFAQETFNDPGSTPNYTFQRDMVYQTLDGFITCGAVQDKEWLALCTALNKPEWVNDERFKSYAAREVNRNLRLNMTEEVIRTMTSKEALARLSEQGVPNGPVYHPRTDVLQDPQVLQNGIIRTMHHPWALHPMRQPRAAAQFDCAPFELRHHAPLLGEHTTEVLRDIAGLSEAELRALHQSGIVEEVSGKRPDPAKAKGRDPRMNLPSSG